MGYSWHHESVLEDLFHIPKLRGETGNVIKYRNAAGQPRILNFNNIHYSLQLVFLCPDWFLDELLELLKTNHFISIHYVTIHQELQRVGVSYKKLKCIASDCNEEAQNDYITHISQFEPNLPQAANLIKFSHFQNDTWVPSYMKIAVMWLASSVDGT